MKLTESRLRQIIREELIRESRDWVHDVEFDPKSGMAVVGQEPNEGMDIYGVKDMDHAMRIVSQWKGTGKEPVAVVQIIKSFDHS